MTLSDLWPEFQSHDIFWSRISEKRRVLYKVTIAIYKETIPNISNATVFGDLDWPLNASRVCQQSAELLVEYPYMHTAPAARYTKRGGKRFGMGRGQNHRGSGDRSPPAGSKTKSPIRSWRILKANFMHFLVLFHTFSPTYAYVFFRACRHHSTKSAKWRGHLIPFAPPPTCLQLAIHTENVIKIAQYSSIKRYEHELDMTDRIQFRISVHRCLHGVAPAPTWLNSASRCRRNHSTTVYDLSGPAINSSCLLLNFQPMDIELVTSLDLNPVTICLITSETPAALSIGTFKLYLKHTFCALTIVDAWMH